MKRMSWYKQSQGNERSLLDMTEKEFAGPDPDPKDLADQDAFSDRRHTWRREMQRAISEGRKTIDEAHKQNFYPQEEIKRLPTTLYHTTTAKDKVISEGLKTRYELRTDRGKGLGGGASNTISFTEDLGIAIRIKEAILEVKAIADGEFTLPMMIEMAKSGEGAKRPWLEETFSRWRSGDEKDSGTGTYPEFIKNTLNGIKSEYSGPLNPDEAKKLLDGGWVQDINDRSIFHKELTEKERREDAFEFYKLWSMFREYVGGPIDPLFFLSDLFSLNNIPKDQIAVLEFRSNGFGHQERALGEWRVWSGKAVEFVRVIE